MVTRGVGAVTSRAGRGGASLWQPEPAVIGGEGVTATGPPRVAMVTAPPQPRVATATGSR